MSEYVILIAGGTGFVGRELAAFFSARFPVRVLSRSRNAHVSGCECFYWNPETGVYDKNAFKGVTHIINVTGENVSAKPWTPAQQKKILDSRISALETLFVAVKQHGSCVQHIISSSAVGFYGSHVSSSVFSEDNAAGTDFLAQVCVAWEQQVQRFSSLPIPFTILRLGVVLGKHNGAFKKITVGLPFKVCVIPGTGKQFVPWVHVQDVVGIFALCVEKSVYGVFNVVAHDETDFKTLCKAIQAQKSALLIRVPAIFLRLVLGKMSHVITRGNRISGHKITTQGYSYTYTNIYKAVTNLLEN